MTGPFQQVSWHLRRRNPTATTAGGVYWDQKASGHSVGQRGSPVVKISPRDTIRLEVTGGHIVFDIESVRASASTLRRLYLHTRLQKCEWSTSTNHKDNASVLCLILFLRLFRNGLSNLIRQCLHFRISDQTVIPVVVQRSAFSPYPSKRVHSSIRIPFPSPFFTLSQFL